MALGSVNPERTGVDQFVQAVSLLRDCLPVQTPYDDDWRGAELEAADCGADRQSRDYLAPRARAFDHDRLERLHIAPERSEAGRFEHLLDLGALDGLVGPEKTNRAASSFYFLELHAILLAAADVQLDDAAGVFMNRCFAQPSRSGAMKKISALRISNRHAPASRR